MRSESMVFYRSFFEAIEDLDDAETKLRVFEAICKYGFDGEEPELKGTEKAIFRLIKPQIDANNIRKLNGVRGGRPRGNETKTKPNNNQNITEPEPNVNVNVNENDNVNENVNENVREEGTPTTHAYGKFANVFLEEHQYDDLKAEFMETDDAIEKMSAYLADEKKTYKNYFARLRMWILQDRANRKNSEPPKKSSPEPYEYELGAYKV